MLENPVFDRALTLFTKDVRVGQHYEDPWGRRYVVTKVNFYVPPVTSPSVKIVGFEGPLNLPESERKRFDCYYYGFGEWEHRFRLVDCNKGE